MEQDITSIINQWIKENPSESPNINSTQVKYASTKDRIYTIYFNAGRAKVKVKALPFDGAWKLINLS